jgi:N-acylneuraminate cytidylyltransferase
MYKNLKIIALIPARGGSKSIPYKNIMPIAGKPLIHWVCSACGKSNYIDEVHVSTEDQKIKDVVNALGLNIKVLDRPEELAGDLTKTEEAMLHAMDNLPFDIIVTVQATSPFTTSGDLDRAIEYFVENNYDSLLTGVKFKKFFWTPDGRPLNYDYKNRPMRQQFEGVINENGAFYITKRNILEEEKCRLGGKIGIFEMPIERHIDIDEPDDWKQAEELLIKMYKDEQQK